MNKLKIFLVALGIFNILLGIIFALLIFMMQGFYLLFMGCVFIIFGVGLLRGHFYKRLIFFGILPVTVIFSFQIIMMSIDKDVPSYYQTPLTAGLLIILPFLLVTLADIFVTRKLARLK